VSASTNWAALTKVYEVTLNVLKDQNNERLWFNTNLKLARVYLESREYNKVENLVEELKR
jgi:COP9 signalosome complex subunit 2